MIKYILIFGNPVDGLKFDGPFDKHDDAVKYAENTGEGDWWIARLNQPETYVDTALEEGTRYERAFGDGSDIL